MKKQEKQYVVRLTSLNDDTSVYFTRLVPHWDYMDGIKVHTETVETTKSEKQATTYNNKYSAIEAVNQIKDWQPEWSHQYDIIVEELIHPALKLRKLCKPMTKLIGLTKALDIKDGTFDENTFKKQKAIYAKMLETINDIEPMFKEILKTVE